MNSLYLSDKSKRQALLALTTLCLAMTPLLSYAKSFTKEPSDKKIGEYTLAKSAMMKSGETSTALQALGAGLRNKKILFVHVKVYVLEAFVADLKAMEKTEDKALSSLVAQPAFALHLHMLRDLDSEKIVNSFKEALEANSFDLKDKAITDLMNVIAKIGKVKEGQELTLYFPEANKDSVVFEDALGEVNTLQGKGLRSAMASIWFGKPADDGLKELKANLLK